MNPILLILAALFFNEKTYAQSCSGINASGVFCTGFEEGNFSTWSDYDGNPSTTNQLVLDEGPHARPGNHVARLFAPPGRGGADLVKVLPSSYARLYARWYIKWETGYNFSTQSHVGGGFHAGARGNLGRSNFRPSATNGWWFSGWFEYDALARPHIYTYYPGMYQDCANPNGSCWGDLFPCAGNTQTYCTNPAHRPRVPPPIMQTNRWHCVEMMMDGGLPTPSQTGASGQMNLWVDGQEQGPWNNLWFKSASSQDLNHFWLNVFFHGEHGTAGVRYDDLVISTAPIGCTNTTPSPTATPAPTATPPPGPTPSPSPTATPRPTPTPTLQRPSAPQGLSVE